MMTAYVGVFLFMLVYFGRPEDWVPGLARIPIAKIVAIIPIIGFLFSIREFRRLPREVIYLLLLFGHLCFTIPFSPIWRGGAFQRVLEFSKVVPIVVVMTMAVTTLTRLRRLLFVQTASVGAVVAVTLLKGSYARGRLSGVIQGTYVNPNELALAIVITLPLAMAFLLRTRKGLRKVIWGPIVVTMIFGVLKTVSRAGFLALLVAVAVCLWEFALKGRRLYLVVLTGMLGLVLCLSSIGPLRTRLSGTFNPQDNLGSAYGSAEARRYLLRRSLEVTAQHPLWGVGPGNFQIVSGFWEVTHNSYTQLSSEAGIPALLLYLMILCRAFANIRAVKREPGAPAENLLFAGALRASLVGYLVGSFFDSLAFEFFPYFLVAYTTALFCATAAPEPVSSAQTKVELHASSAKGFNQSYGRIAKLEKPRNFS